jgi:hypothetical protein
MLLNLVLFKPHLTQSTYGQLGNIKDRLYPFRGHIRCNCIFFLNKLNCAIFIKKYLLNIRDITDDKHVLTYL